MRALSAFAVLTLALLNLPAWGGGWESSGSPRNAPVIAPAAEYLPYTCQITVQVTGEEDQFNYTEVLKPEHFKNGYVHLVTPSLPGREFLAGHELTFSGRNADERFDGSLSIGLVANMTVKGRSIAKASVSGYAPMKNGYVTTRVSLTNPKTGQWMSVSASCYPTVR